jgi:hypothetical protein
LKGAWFQPLNASSENPVSKYAFQIQNLRRYKEEAQQQQQQQQQRQAAALAPKTTGQKRPRPDAASEGGAGQQGAGAAGGDAAGVMIELDLDTVGLYKLNPVG